MPGLVLRVRLNLESHRLRPCDGRLLVAVSGGLDSMALLAVLQELSGDCRLSLVVAHANHQLRGADADADQELVTETARKAGLEVRVGRLPVRETRERTRESLEMTSRRLRHRFLAETALQMGIRTIALAHHADDQAELVLLRMVRGAGGEGLAGMAWSDASPADGRLRLIRPLLDIPKADLRSFAEAGAIPFREDTSNQDLNIQRNRIRHELRPWLEREFNPALGTVLQRTAQVVGADADFVFRAAVRWRQAKRRASFERLHVAVQRAVIRQQLWELGQASDFELVEQLRRSTGGVSVGPGQKLNRDASGAVRRQSIGRVAPHQAGQWRFELGDRPLRIQAGKVEIRCSAVPDRPVPLRAVRGLEHFDADAVGSVVILRHWQPGDRFRPLGFPQPGRLQNVFVNRRIPMARRRELVVGVANGGKIFWVEGLPPGEEFKVTPGTVRVLRWNWRRRP